MLCMTRVQDRYDTAGESKGVDTSKFHLKYEHLDLLSDSSIIMHPLPRRNELDPRIDNDPELNIGAKREMVCGLE